MTGYVEVGSLLYAFTIDILAPNNQISEWQITDRNHSLVTKISFTAVSAVPKSHWWMPFILNKPQLHLRCKWIGTYKLTPMQKYKLILTSDIGDKPNCLTACKIGWNHGWSNGPPMMALWVVRSILGGPLKIQVNSKLLHHCHRDFRVFLLRGLHTILLEIDFIQNKTSWKTLITFGEK